MNALDFLLITCATLRISTVIAREDAPFKLASRLRARFTWFSCVWCVSVWVGFALVVTHVYAPLLTWGFAASGAAMLLRSHTGYLHDEPS